jgi:hypothetical protein
MEDSDDDLGPEDDDAWLFEDLNLLLKLWTKRREKEGLLALIFEVGHDIVAASTLLTNRVLLQNCSRTSSQSSTLLLLRCIRRLVLPTLWVIYRIS